MAIADRIAVVDGGKIRQIGSPREVYERPVSAFVAAFMGAANLFPGVVRRQDGHAAFVEIDGGLSVLVPQSAAAVGRAVKISIRPEAFQLRAGAAQSSDEWPGRVASATYVGNVIIYRVKVGPHLVEVHASPTESFALGLDVCLTAAAEHRILIDDESRA